MVVKGLEAKSRCLRLGNECFTAFAISAAHHVPMVLLEIPFSWFSLAKA